MIRNMLNDLLKASELKIDSRWRQWAKHIDSIDMSSANGYMFVGEFVPPGTTEVPAVPSLFLVASETGSHKYRTTTYAVVRMDSDGTLHKTDIKTDSETPGWALRIRDSVLAELRQLQEPNYIIVTRHTGLVDWLAKRGITGTVVEHATPADVQGRHVIGALPLHLAALAADVSVVDLPGLRPEQRGADLTPDEMDLAGAVLNRYRVIREA